jgi:hypothetical protein
VIKSASRSSITNDQKYRSMLAGAVPSSEYLIESAIVSTATPSVTFSNLAQYAGVYKHLQVVATARMTTGSVFGIYSRLNADSGTNYTFHLLYGNGSTVISSPSVSNTSLLTGLSSASTSEANVYSSAIIDLLDPYSAKNKTFRSISGVVTTGVHLHSGIWLDTASLTSWELLPQSGSWAAGSRFSLYGVTA